MKRRGFGTLVGVALTASTAWSSLLSAQQKAMPVIGWLSGNAPVSATNPYVTAFREGLGEIGYVEGRNVAFENRWADSHFDRFPQFVADLIGRRVDVIVAISDPAVHAARNATLIIPIVFISGDDPVAAGFATSKRGRDVRVGSCADITACRRHVRLPLGADIAPTRSNVSQGPTADIGQPAV